MTTADVTTITTPAGPLTIVAQHDAVIAAAFSRDVDALVARIPAGRRPNALHATTDLGAITKAVDAYNEGDLTAIDEIAVDQPAAPFMARALAEMRAIAPGTTISYVELARRAGSPRAIRAAGQACARNLAALFVPCHRVVASDGTLHDYLFGLDAKQALLRHEGVPA